MQTIGWEEQILSAIQEPDIPQRSFSIVDFGAVSHADVPQTAAIQAAIDHAAAQGGGRVVVPSGRFLTGALRLKSHVELHLENADSVLAFSKQTDESNYPMVYCHWEASPCWNYSPLIYAVDEHDVAVTGCGLLDGQADAQTWWCWHHQTENAWSEDKQNLQDKARMAHRAMNAAGVPVNERRFGDGHYLRPPFIQTLRCDRVLFKDFTLNNSPAWQIVPVQCKSLICDGLTLSSHGPNNDGLDPESCNGVLIQNCRFDTGDDCISLKSGRDRDGRVANIPCENVVIRNNVCADGHGGIALGSETSGGLRNIIAHHNHFDSAHLTYALRMKTNAVRGGVQENIWMHHCDIKNVDGAAIHATMLYEDGRRGEHLPCFRNIVIEDVVAHGGDYGIFMEAFDEVPITGLELRRIRIDGAKRPFRALNWVDPVIEDVVINGMPFPRPCQVRILGVPAPGETVEASAQGCGAPLPCSFEWILDGECIGQGESLTLPEGSAGKQLCLNAISENDESTRSISYLVLDNAENRTACRLRTRRLWDGTPFDPEAPITRRELARLLEPLGQSSTASIPEDLAADDPDLAAVQTALGSEMLALQNGRFVPEGFITRQEMGTVAMQSCGVSYKNASTTHPVCTDADDVNVAYGTNAARSLYYGFQTLDENNCYHPLQPVTWADAFATLEKVADYAGL